MRKTISFRLKQEAVLHYDKYKENIGTVLVHEYAGHCYLDAIIVLQNTYVCSLLLKGRVLRFLTQCFLTSQLKSSASTSPHPGV